jgi:hypothetical protein
MVGLGTASFGRGKAAGLALCKCMFFTYRQSEPTLEFIWTSTAAQPGRTASAAAPRGIALDGQLM